MKIDLLAAGASLKRADLAGVGRFEPEKDRLKAGFTGKTGDTLLVPNHTGTKAGAVLLIGLGKREACTLETVRKAAAKLVAAAKGFRNQTAALHLDTLSGGKFSPEKLTGAAIEGARLSDYSFRRYKSKKTPDRRVDRLYLVSERITAGARRAAAEAERLAEAVYFTRDIANEPPNVLFPAEFSRRVKAMASKNGLVCRVMGRAGIRRLKMGGLLGVAQGSVFEPQFIILSNRVVRPKFKDPIVLVGKGITFDTGGISIKPSNDMDKMKFDMCGAAAVAGAMMAVANLKLPVRVIGVMPVCENMVGSSAQRPGDIVTISNGKTVEVLNTDAEGRLILADALAYTARLKPKALVDVATLTGACAATFADRCSGLMSTDPDVARRLMRAGEQTGERLWELPLWDEYFDLIKAAYADIQNISKKYAGTITAGMFLKEFTGHTKAWAHLDIAGTAWNEGAPKPLSPIGATGVGVRLFVEFVKSYL
ncbi:MAG: hypothetical protein A3D28_02095 [Omnitrophica bacterium RIFCSPHIGHO2_02_FULL_63_14]|nr:MAG: hypothetical protein A3D28_02095 [Omnitrophica bacterium RIFCSPHIGHO2_02_FULL_63_14]